MLSWLHHDTHTHTRAHARTHARTHARASWSSPPSLWRRLGEHYTLAGDYTKATDMMRQALQAYDVSGKGVPSRAYNQVGCPACSGGAMSAEGQAQGTCWAVP
jgi:hypothetical protein